MDWPPNVTYEEMTRSRQARKWGIDNNCPDELLDELINTAWKLQHAMDILSQHFGVPVPLRVTSGFRSQKFNARLTGNTSSTGVHPLGKGVDFVPIGFDINTCYRVLSENKEFMIDVDQLINEQVNGLCIHIGRARNGKPRRQLLHDEISEDGRRHYVLDGTADA